MRYGDKIRAFITSGKAWELFRESWAVSWPMALIMLFEFLIGLADVFVAGRLSKETQAAYGLAFQLYFVFIFVGIAISVGTVSVVSRLFGSDDKVGLARAIHSSLVISAGAGILFGVAGFLLSDLVVGSFNIPLELKSITAPLVKIYSLGFIFDYILITLNAILRSVGKIRHSMVAMIVSCSLNIALNFMFALGTPLGASGIAWATVISLGIGSLVAVFGLKGIVGRITDISVSIIKSIIKISWPSGVLQILWQLSAATLFLIIGALPRHGVEVMAAFTNGMKIESAIFLPAFAFNMAAAVVVGNLIGKGDRHDAFKGGIVTAMIGVGIVAAMSILVFINARMLSSFLSPDPVVRNECVRYIRIALVAEPLMAWAVILGGALSGAGDTRSVMFITAVSVWIVRIPASFIFGLLYGFGPTAIWWSMNVGLLTHAILVTRRYFSRRWMVEAHP